MSQFASAIVQLTAGEALEANRRVRLNSSAALVYADAGERCIGVTQAAAANGATVAVKLWGQGGTQAVVATGAIAAGAPVYGTADGKVDDAIGSGMQIGVCKAAVGAGGHAEIVPYAAGQSDIFTVGLMHQAPGAAITRHVADRPCFLLSLNKRVDVVGSDGGAVTSAFWKAPSGTAPASGTAQLASGSFNLKGTANTNQALTLSTTASDRTYATGDALVEVFTGTTAAAVGGGTAVFAILD
jgi:hypothetical protein